MILHCFADVGTRERVQLRSDRRLVRSGRDEIRRPPWVAKSTRRRSSVRLRGRSVVSFVVVFSGTEVARTTYYPISRKGPMGRQGCTWAGGAGTVGPSAVYVSGGVDPDRCGTPTARRTAFRWSSSVDIFARDIWLRLQGSGIRACPWFPREVSWRVDAVA